MEGDSPRAPHMRQVGAAEANGRGQRKFPPASHTEAHVLTSGHGSERPALPAEALRSRAQVDNRGLCRLPASAGSSRCRLSVGAGTLFVMTNYSYDSDLHSLGAAWNNGLFYQSRTVAALSKEIATEQAQQLARALTRHSQSIWEVFEHPAAQYGNPEELNTSAWRWAEVRKDFAAVPKALEKPHVPTDGSIVWEYSEVLESAHGVGRALHSMDAPEQLRDLIRCEVEAELAAIEQAEAGDLSGRATQAKALSRPMSAPNQVASAWADLLADPLEAHDKLLRGYEPSSAAAAAAACLHAAALATEEVSGTYWTHVVLESDNIQAINHEAPTELLELIDSGLTPREAVHRMLKSAQAIAAAELPDSTKLFGFLRDAMRFEAQGTQSGESGLRLTPIDLTRPAPDLLEDLLAGISACYLLWLEYACSDVIPDEDVAEDDEPEKRAAQEILLIEAFNEEIRQYMRDAAADTGADH
jgi:hypothetical protein